MPLWEVWPRDADLGRTQDPVIFTGLEVVERFNVNDTWVLTGPAESLSVFAPGMGCILDRDGEQVASGQVRSLRRWDRFNPDSGAREVGMEVGFASDMAALGGRVVLPSPSHAVGPTVSQFPVAEDARTGPAEDLILGYIRSHLGDLALADRRLVGLLVPESQGRGPVLSVAPRFTNLGLLVQDLAEAGGLRVTLQHDESTGVPQLRVVITPVQDVSLNVRFGPASEVATGSVTEWEYSLRAPSTTRVFALGGGEGAKRQVLQIVSTEAESLWGMVSEATIDQRSSDPLDDEGNIPYVVGRLESLRDQIAQVRDYDTAVLTRATAIRDFAQSGVQGVWPWIQNMLAELLRDWDSSREANPADLFSELVNQVGSTTHEDSTLSDTLDAHRDTWSGIRSPDNQRRTPLQNALEESQERTPDYAAWLGYMNDALARLAETPGPDEVVRVAVANFIAPYQTAAQDEFDRRHTETVAELTQAATEALSEAAGESTISLTVADSPDVQYRRDYGIGYRVGVDLPGLPDAAADNTVREIATTVTGQLGQPTERLAVVVGSREASVTQTIGARRLTEAMHRIAALERKR